MTTNILHWNIHITSGNQERKKKETINHYYNNNEKYVLTCLLGRVPLAIFFLTNAAKRSEGCVK